MVKKLDILGDDSVKNKNIHKLSDLKPQLQNVRDNGLSRGFSTGFESFDRHYSIKEGSTTYIIAPAFAGKTAVIYELLINLARFNKQKVALFSPEAGSPVELYAELMWAVLCKPFYKHEYSHLPTASDKEVEEAYAFIDEHFFIIDGGLSEMDAAKVFNAVKDVETENNVKIGVLVIDPLTELEINPKSIRDDQALNTFLSKVRKFSSQYKIHTFLAVHTRQQQLVTAKDINGETIYYNPQPKFTDTSGGMMFSRKGLMIISLWRPPKGLINPETQEEYHPHESVIEILKVKPKTLGQIGKVSLYYEYASSRFYELIDGEKMYARDLEKENKSKPKIPF